MFVDEMKMIIQAGSGGNGCMSFRREKYVPKGGPDGGDGGKGGDIIFEGHAEVNSLTRLRQRQHYRGERGEHGKGKDMHGRNGLPCIVKVPMGTIVRNAETGEFLTEILENGQRVVIQKGGRGGKGNARFSTATNRVPRYSEDGQVVEPISIRLELKLIADVALVGFPNSGKSTLISRISSASPKVDEYEFTTLHPNLGVVTYDDFKSFLVADIPGLIEGAAEGRGLGIKFLRHIERTRVLLHLLDGATPHGSLVQEFETIREEVKKFNANMLDRHFAVAVNKMDSLFSQDDLKEISRFCRENQIPIFQISAVTGKGLDTMVPELGHLVEASRPAPTTIEITQSEEPSQRNHFLNEV
ncbi:MAG: GTPase ObgE [Acidobacteria bacterium]|nr:GTPase ObgE [Acidobacteriota bacterium]